MASMEALEALDAATLASKLEDITRKNEFIQKENATLDAYLRRHVSAEEAEEWADEDNRRGRKGKGRKLRATALTTDQKLDVTTAEMDAVKKEFVSFDSQSSRTIDALKAMLEQIDLRITSMKREAYEFKRDVVVAGENPRTGRTMAEKVIKYYEDQTRNKDGIVDKLRLKNQTLRAQLAKLETSLKQKDEVGDVLHYIDFHQLQIENKQYLAKIEEKNAELMRLKLSTGQTIQTLNSMKVQLGDVARETSRLKGEIKTRTQLLTRLRSENVTLAETIAKSQDLGLTLARVARESSDMPTIMDYVELKALQANLAKEATSWERKMEIMQLTANQTKSKARALDTFTAAQVRSSGRFEPGATSRATTAGGPVAMRAPSSQSAMSSTLGSAVGGAKSRTPAAVHRMPDNGSYVFRAGMSPADIVGPKGVAGFAGTKSGGMLRLGLTRKPAGAS